MTNLTYDTDSTVLDAKDDPSINPYLPDIVNFLHEGANRNGPIGIANEDIDPYDLQTLTWDKLVSQKDELLIREGGYEPSAIRIYKNLATDQAVSSSYLKLTQEIVGREYQVNSHKQMNKINASKQAEIEKDLVERCLLNFNFDNFCSELLEAYLCGISYQELFYEKIRGEILVKASRYRDQARFKFDRTGKLHLINNFGQYADISRYAVNFIYFRYYHMPHRNPYGLGLGRMLFHPVLFLRRAIESWLYTAERYALPVTVVKYGDDAKLKDQLAIFHRIQRLSRKKTMMLPQTWDLIFVGNDAKADFFKQQIDVYSDIINLLICGESVTGESVSGGNYGKDAISKSLLVMRAKYLSEKLAFTINNSLIKYIVDLNYPNRDKHEGYPTVSFGFPDLDDKPDLGEVLAIHQIKPVDFAWVSKTYGIQFATEEQIQEQISQENRKNVFQQKAQAKAQLELGQDENITAVSQAQVAAADVTADPMDQEDGADPAQPVGQAAPPGQDLPTDPYSSLAGLQ